jgi:Endoglucanase
MQQTAPSVHANDSTYATRTLPQSNIRVSGNHLIDKDNQIIQLRGVNRSGTEYMCTGDSGIFDGPNSPASIDAMLTWHINAVRIPLNEDCWLGINGLPSAGYSALTYRQAISSYVNLLNAKNVLAVLDLHWNAPGAIPAKGQQSMPDMDHAPAFWNSVAATFRNNSAVIFDLYNEPHPENWTCWRVGSAAPSTYPCNDIDFKVAGMQTLLNVVRAAGASNIVMVGGLRWANDMSGWLANRPYDPSNNTMAAFHLYNFNACIEANCWGQNLLPILAHYPLAIGELGENDCQSGFVTQAMNWFDQYSAGYLSWAWTANDCKGFPSLISDYSGTPTQFGIGFRDHFTALAHTRASGNCVVNGGPFALQQRLCYPRHQH